MKYLKSFGLRDEDLTKSATLEFVSSKKDQMVRELTKLSSELDSAFNEVTVFLDSLVSIDTDTNKTVDLIKKDIDN